MTSPIRYENVPVFRPGAEYSPERIVGKANVQFDEETNRVTITIESTSDKIADFLRLGTLRSFDLGAMVDNVNPETVASYHEKLKESLND